MTYEIVIGVATVSSREMFGWLPTEATPFCALSSTPHAGLPRLYVPEDSALALPLPRSEGASTQDGPIRAYNSDSPAISGSRERPSIPCTLGAREAGAVNAMIVMLSSRMRAVRNRISGRATTERSRSF